MTKRRRLSSLTAEQRALFPVIRDKWIAIGLSTEPADRQRAEAAIRLAYRCAGLREPRFTVWLDSPLAGAIGVEYIKAIHKTIEKDLTDRVWVRPSVRERVEASVSQSVSARVGTSLWASVGKRVGPRVWAKVGKSLWALVANVDRRVESCVWETISLSVWGSVKARVSARVSASVSRDVRESVRSVETNIGGVGENVLEGVAASIGLTLVAYSWMCRGQHDAIEVAWIDAHTHFGLGDVTAPADGLTALCESCGWCWTFSDVAILTERHSQLHRDNRGRLHNPHGMAVQYPDGWGLYAWHGVSVPEAVIVNPVTVQQIRDERNAEIRRVLLERYGADRFVTDSGALPVHADECGTLYRVALDNDEPLVLVRLVNSTPEPTRERGLIEAPDGTWRKQYWLRVPPDVHTAREAVAWTFGLRPDDYRPAVET